MKLYSICTRPAAVLKEGWFLKTLRDDWELHISDLDDVPPGNGDYLSREWYHCISKKFNILLDAVAANPGEIIIWADIDIQFFRPCAGIIRRCMPDRDIARAFFEAVSATDFSHRAFADQDAINDLLKAGSPPVRWGVFPRTVYHVYLGPAPGRIALHHGCGAPPPGMRDGRFVSSIEHKIEQFGMIRRRVQTPWWRTFLHRANQLRKRF